MSDSKQDRFENGKKAAGERAVDFIQDGMIVGIGTGSTVSYFIEKLIKQCQKGLKIQAVATSFSSLERVKAGKIPLVDINTLTKIDLTVDGADEIDSEKKMIKGGGGALLREKIVAHMSHEMVIIEDETKVVSRLGERKLPVEILPFGYVATMHHLSLLGYPGDLRLEKKRTPYLTDNGNYIYDITLNPATVCPREDHQRLIQIPGVIETGFFFNLNSRVIIGFSDGRVSL